MTENTIVCVGCGLKTAKKPEQSDLEYLNFGLLGLATKISEAGFDVEVYQDDSFLDLLPQRLIHPVLVSVPSFLSVTWAVDIMRRIKERCDCKILVGGRWVVDGNEDWCRAKFSDADALCNGCPDDYVHELESLANFRGLHYNSIGPFERFNYTLLHGFKRFQPSIEVQRGCAGICSYCPEKRYAISRVKRPEDVIAEMLDVIEQYGTGSLNFYLEGANFSPSESWARSFAALYKQHNLSCTLRMTCRVDTLNKQAVPYLAQAGLRVLDMGLESASPTQLVRMHKCGNPDRYLEEAVEKLQVAARNNVLVKLNLLIYAGETQETLEETKVWLKAHASLIKGVSVNVLTVYLNGADTDVYVNELCSDYDCIVDREALYRDGYVEVGIPGITQGIVSELKWLVMSEQDYAELKQFGYTRRVEVS